MVKVTVNVEGMMCGHCEAHVNKAIQAAFGAGSQVFNGAGSIVDHAYQHGVFLVQTAEQPVCAGSVRHNGAVSVKGTPVVEKAHL